MTKYEKKEATTIANAAGNDKENTYVKVVLSITSVRASNVQQCVMFLSHLLTPRQKQRVTLKTISLYHTESGNLSRPFFTSI